MDPTVERYYEACRRHKYFDLVFLSIIHEGHTKQAMEAVLHVALARRGPITAGENWLLELRFRGVRDLTLRQPWTIPMSIHPLLFEPRESGYEVRDCEDDSLRFLCRDFDIAEKSSPERIGLLPLNG
jgi:hypothetical protein